MRSWKGIFEQCLFNLIHDQEANMKASYHYFQDDEGESDI